VIHQHDQIENELIQDTLDIHIVVEDTRIISPGKTIQVMPMKHKILIQICILSTYICINIFQI
jgi:hypothetical protein